MAYSKKVQERIDKMKSGDYKITPSGHLVKKQSKKKKRELTEEEKQAKEQLRRERISLAYKARKEKRRREGYEKWLKEKHKEMAEREKAEKKEKERKRREKERLRAHKKKKIGRPRKPGPKKKRKSRAKKVVKPIPVYNYKIVTCHNGRQTGYVGQYYTESEAQKELVNLVQENDRKVIFARRVDNTETIENSHDEFLLLEKDRTGEKRDRILKNEYGKFVGQKSNSEKWRIIAKSDFKTEETFWVWGCNPKTERKTFQWIYLNVILDGLEEHHNIKRIFTYKNKVVLKDDNEEIRLVICKTVSDAVAFYNLANEWARKRKDKQLYFLGSLNIPGPRKKKIEREIMDLTGWDVKKVQMSSTKKHKKKKE